MQPFTADPLPAKRKTNSGQWLENFKFQLGYKPGHGYVPLGTSPFMRYTKPGDEHQSDFG